MTVAVRVVQFALRTTLGTQDITVSGAGTCKGYVLISSGASANNTLTAEASFMVGFCDSSGNVRSITSCSDDGVGTMDTYVRQDSNSLRAMRQNGTDIWDCVHNSFITDGFRIEVVDAPAAAFLVTAWVFYGDDVSTSVFTLTTSATNGVEVLATSGQPTDLLLALSSGNIPQDTLSSFNFVNLGVALNKGSSPFTQFNHACVDFDGGSTSRMDQYVMNTRISNDYGINAGYEVTTFTPTQVGITSRSDPTSSAKAIYLMSIHFRGAANVSVGTFTAPTANGSTPYTGVGFTPQFVAMMFTQLAGFVDETGSPTTGAAGMHAVCSTDGTTSTVVTHVSEHGVGPSNTQSFTRDQFVHTLNDDGSDANVGTLTSLDSDGWTVNYSANGGAADVGFYLAVAQSAVGPASFARRMEHKPAPNSLLRR